jgi:hypothetical protein
MKGNTTTAVLVAGLVVTAGLVGFVTPAFGADGATTVEQCRTISEPGVYELESDLTDDADSPNACIEIESDDVVIDGNGHNVTNPDKFQSDTRTLYGVRASGVENVTVTNLTAKHYGYTYAKGTGLLFENASDVTLRDVTSFSSWNGIGVRNTTDVTVRDATWVGGGISTGVPQSGTGLALSNVENASVRGGTLDSWNLGLSVERSANVRVADVQFNPDGNALDFRNGIEVRTTDSATIRNNTFNFMTSGAVTLERGAGNVTVAANRFVNGSEGVTVQVFDAGSGPNVVRNNEFTSNGHGVEVLSTTSPLYVEENRFVRNGDAVTVERSGVCTNAREGGQLVVAHHNAFVNNSVGIDNEGRDVVNATHNYWGAESGPSSVTDSDRPFGERDDDLPLEDPVTGALADGEGDAVSEFDEENESGTSNVHFDPWLEMPPEDEMDGTNDTDATNETSVTNDTDATNETTATNATD